MQALVETLVQALVGHADGWEIKERLGVGRTIILEIRIAKNEQGRVIGKGGSHLEAVRTIVRAAQSKHDARYVLEVTNL